MSIKNTWYLSDSIGFVKHMGIVGDGSNRGSAASGPKITIQFKMPMYMTYDWFNAIGEIEFDYFNRSNISPTTDYRVPYIVDNSSIYTNSIKSSTEAYNMLLSKGVMHEIARGVLPQCMYIEFTETGSVKDYMTFCEKFKDNILVGIYCKLIHSLIKDAWPLLCNSKAMNVHNIKEKGMSDDPAEYQWGC